MMDSVLKMMILMQISRNMWLAKVEWRKRAEFVGGKVIARMRLGVIVGAWETWVTTVEEIKRMRYVVNKIVLQIQNRVVHMVMNTWRSQTEWKRKAKHVANKVIARVQLSVIVAVWNMWSTWTEDCIRNRKPHVQFTPFDFGDVPDRLLVMAGAIVRKVVLRMHNAIIDAAFFSWLERTEWRRRAKYVEEKTMRQMSNAALLGAWNAWVVTVEEKLRMKHVVGKIFGRMQNGLLASAFRNWAEVVDERHRMKAAAVRIVGYLKNNQILGSFNTWCDLVEGSRRSKALARKVVLHMQAFILRMAWKQWVLVVERGQAAHLLHAQAEAFQARTLGLLESQRQRDIGKLLELCFWAWSEEVGATEQLQRFELDALRQYLWAWRGYAGDTAREKAQDEQQRKADEAKALQKQLAALHASTRLRQQELDMKRRGLEERARRAEDQIEHAEMQALRQVETAESKAKQAEEMWREMMGIAQKAAMANVGASLASPPQQPPPPVPPPIPMTPPRSAHRHWTPAGDPNVLAQTRSTVLDLRKDGSLLVSPARGASPQRGDNRDRPWRTPPNSGGSASRQRRRRSARKRPSGSLASPERDAEQEQSTVQEQTGWSAPAHDRAPSPLLAVAVAAALANEMDAVAESGGDVELAERMEAWVAKQTSPPLTLPPTKGGVEMANNGRWPKTPRRE